MDNIQFPPFAGILKKYNIKMEKSGKNLIGLCPFHNEKTPSFTIHNSNKGKELFYCFGCGAQGDVFDFISKITGQELSEVFSQLPFAGHNNKMSKLYRRESRIRTEHEKFQKWLRQAIDDLCLLIRSCDFVLPNACLSDKFDLLSLQQRWEYYYDLLMFGDDRTKHEIYREFKLGF
jgi:hypothetical protein